ncbi:MAG: hypothetical protein KAX42_00540 [Sphaerotilus sp.]|jgi:hypothetical protein|nr:hypothetical protein [Sphaerotilus sp.]
MGMNSRPYNLEMLRRWFALLLLLLQLQPAMGFMPSRVVDVLVQEIQHTAVHQSGQGHHHDDVLSFQSEEDGPSVAHVHHDAGHHSVLLLSSHALAVPGLEPVYLADFHSGHLPDPYLEGPLRPPRFSV